jgi:type IV secretory pathway VirB4 component
MVRAIDVQQSILQTSSTEKIQQIQQQHADMQQRYFQLKLSEEDRLAQEKIREFEEAEKTKIRKRQEKENKRKGPGHNPPHHTELAADENDESEEGGLINIKV